MLRRTFGYRAEPVKHLLTSNGDIPDLGTLEALAAEARRRGAPDGAKVEALSDGWGTPRGMSVEWHEEDRP